MANTGYPNRGPTCKPILCQCTSDTEDLILRYTDSEAHQVSGCSYRDILWFDHQFDYWTRRQRKAQRSVWCNWHALTIDKVTRSYRYPKVCIHAGRPAPAMKTKSNSRYCRWTTRLTTVMVTLNPLWWFRRYQWPTFPTNFINIVANRAGHMSLFFLVIFVFAVRCNFSMQR